MFLGIPLEDLWGAHHPVTGGVWRGCPAGLAATLQCAGGGHDRRLQGEGIGWLWERSGWVGWEAWMGLGLGHTGGTERNERNG